MKSLTELILDNPEDIMNGAETTEVKAITDMVSIMLHLGHHAAMSRTSKSDIDIFGNKLNICDIFFNFGSIEYPIVGHYIYGIKRKRLIAKRYVYKNGDVNPDMNGETEVYIDEISGKIKWLIKVK